MTAGELRSRTVGSCHRDGCWDGFVVDGLVSRPCLCMQVFRYLLRLHLARIPLDYWFSSFDDWVIPEKYREYVKGYLRSYRNVLDRGMGLLFMGSNGIGKTTLMAEIGKHFALLDCPVRYFTIQEFVNSRFSEEPIDLGDYDVLLADELDKAYAKPGSDWLHKTFEELIRQIESKNKVVVMATNASEERLERMFGASSLSAIKRKIRMVPMVGDDHSEKMQDSWATTDGIDLFNPVIVRMAQNLEYR